MYNTLIIRAHSLVMQGLDLRQYAREIETELRRVEYHSVQDCIHTHVHTHTDTLDLDRDFLTLFFLDIDQSRNIAKLHGQIKDCDEILAVSMESGD